MDEKLQQIYDLYVSKGLIKNTDFGKFSSASPEQIKSLYDLGTSKGLFKTTDFKTFSSAFTPQVKKKEATIPSAPSSQPSSIGGQTDPGTAASVFSALTGFQTASTPSQEDVAAQARQFDEFMAKQSSFKLAEPFDFGQNKTFVGAQDISQAQSNVDVINSEIVALNDSREQEISEAMSQNANQSEIDFINARYDKLVADKDVNLQSSIKTLESLAPVLSSEQAEAAESEERIKQQEAQAAFESTFEVYDDDDPRFIAAENKQRQIENLTKDISGNLIGMSEEDVVKRLYDIVSTVDSDYQLFDFEESGAGRDEIIVRNRFTGDSMKISLDNWTDARDVEEAKILRGFIQLNAEFPEYSVITKRINDLKNDNSISETQRNQEIYELSRQKARIKSRIRNYASDDKYLSYAYSKMNEARSIDYDISKVNLQKERIEATSKEYQEGIDFLKSGQYDQMSDTQKAEAMQGLNLSAQQMKDQYNILQEDTQLLYDKTEDLNEIAGQSYIVAENRGNLASGIMKSFTEGLVSPLTFLARATASERGVDPNEIKAEDMASDLYEGVIDQEYLSSMDRNMLEQALFGVSESIGAALGGTVLMPAAPTLGQFMGLYSMSYMDMRDEMNSPEFDDISDGEKMLFSSVYGATIGILDRIGISKAISKSPAGKTAARWIFRETMKNLPKNATAEMLEKELKSSARNAFSKGLLDFAAGSSAEAGTEALQELGDITLKSLYNEVKGKDLFENPENLTEVWDRVSNAFILGAIGGGTMNATSQIMRTGKSQWTKATMKSVEKTVMNPGLNEAFKKHVEAQVAKGEMTQETADQVIESMVEAEEMFKSIPDNVKGEDRYTALTLIAERKSIEDQIKGKERSLVKAETQRISEINQQLADIGSKPVPEAEVAGGTQEETGTVMEDAPISETVNINYEEGADVEYKIGEDFYSESDFIEKLNNEEFIGQVRNGQVELNVQNPSQAVESLLLTPKPVQDEVQQTQEAKDQAQDQEVVTFDKDPESTPTLTDAIKKTNGNLSRLSGKANQETRRKIIEEVTGEKVPLSKAGINNLIAAVDGYLGVDTGKVRPRINDDISAWANKQGVEKTKGTPTPIPRKQEPSVKIDPPTPSGRTITVTSGQNSRQKKFVLNAEVDNYLQAIKQTILSGLRLDEGEMAREAKLSPSEMKERKTFFKSTTAGGAKVLSIDDMIEFLKTSSPNSSLFETIPDSEIRQKIIDIFTENRSAYDLQQSLTEDFSVDGIIYERVNDRAAASTFQEEMNQAKIAEDQEVISQQQEEDARLEADIELLSEEQLLEEEASLNEYLETLTDEEIEDQFREYDPERTNQESTAETEGANLEEDTGQEQKIEIESFESSVTKGTKSALDWLSDLESKLDEFGNETLGVNIPVAVAKIAVKAAKVAAKGTNEVSKIVDAGIDAVKESDWYKGLSNEEKADAEQTVKNIFERPSEVVIEKDQKKAKKESESEPKSKRPKEVLFDEEGKKKRLFPLQVDEDAEISDEIKEGLSEDARKYIPITNEVTVSEANAIIEQKGIEQATKDVLNTKNAMTPRVRVAIALELIKKYNEIGTSEAIESAVELADSISRYATELGQAVQIFSLWNRITADGMLLAYERNQSDVRKSIKEQNSELYRGVKSGYKSGNKKAGKKAAQKVFGKNTPKTKKAKSFGLSKQQIEKGKKDALARLKKATKGGPLTSGGINVEALEALTDYGFYVFADGVRTFAEWAKKMKNDTGIKDESVLNDIWMNRKGENGKTLDQLADLSSLENQVSEFFAEDTDPTALSEMLQKSFNLDQDLADGLAQELVSEFNKVAKASRKAEINRKVTGRVSKKVRSAIDAISESDGLKSKDIDEKIEEAFGVKSITEEQIQKIKELEEERQSRPEGFLQDEVTREMLSEFDKFKGIPKADILWSLWYAGVLSGYETQMLNIGANSVNIGMETFVSSIELTLINRDPAAFGQAISGLFKGMRSGWDEFTQVLEKGFSPAKIRQKLEVKDTLENVNFWGGKLNPYNYYKYVGRFLMAGDTAAYMAAFGMRKQEAARQYYREEGLRGKELSKKVTEVTSNNQEAYDSAFNQATEEVNAIAEREGYSAKQKKRIIRMRTNEILNEKLPEEVRTESEKFAAFATYNYNPQGILGTIAMALSTLGQKRGMGWFRLIVPFTRVVANVLNQQIDYTPYGFLRAFGLNAGRNMKESTKAKDIRDRNRKLIKATLGLIGMTAVYALAKAYEDDDDPWFAITGKGPSDYNKRYQLYSQGWKPYSIKVGDTWINYQYSPVGLGFSYIGNWMDGEKYEGLSESSNSGRLAHAMQSSVSGVFDMSFLTGLGAFFDGLSTVGDPEKTKEKLLKTVGRTGSSFFVPNLFKQIDKTYDPTIYDKTTVYAAVMSEIPVVKRYSGLKPKINAFGQEVEKKGTRFATSVADDKIWKFMAKNNLFAPGMSPQTKMLDGEVMTDEEFYDYAKLSGEYAYKTISDNLETIDSLFEDLDHDQKKKYISRVFSLSRRRAKVELYDKYR